MSLKQPNYITPGGLAQIREELNNLLSVERPQLVKTVAWAAGNGDRSENADYIYGKRRLREIDRRVRFLQGRLDNIEVIDPKSVQSDVVSFGATVTIRDENDKESTYQIVGVDEINVSFGKISYNSPLAKSLLGKKCGDIVQVQRPAGILDVEIVEIKYF